MPPIQQADLPSAGPRPPEPTVTAATAALEGSVRCVLDDRGLLAFHGRDAVAFLNGQLSTDVHALVPGGSTLTSWSDARGRLLAVGRLYAETDRLLLELPTDLLETTRQRLARYVLRSDVMIADESDAWARIGVAGQSAAVTLRALTGPLPDEPGTSTRTEQGVSIVCLGGTRPRWELLGPPATIAAIWNALSDHATAGGADAWRLLDVEAGLPTVHAETTERFVAQMLNLDRLGALDFRKGCYPGQEVIARTHYLGRIKRRMCLLRVPDADVPPEPGMPVLAEGEPAGEVVESAAHPDGGSLTLAVLREGVAGTLTLGSADGPQAERRALPYAVDDDAS